MTGYSGRVRVGGPPDVRELPNLVITKVAVGGMDNNCYLLRCRRTGAQLLVDAAADAPLLLELAGAGSLQAVVTTHAHADHYGALSEVVAATGARTFAHPADAAALPVETDVLVQDDDRIHFGDVQLLVTHLQGHTDGSIVLGYDDPDGHPHLFTGDCLFPGGVGRTDDARAFDSLYSGVVSKLFDRFPDETWVYPGHGADTTLGAERPELPAWRERGW